MNGADWQMGTKEFKEDTCWPPIKLSLETEFEVEAAVKYGSGGGLAVTRPEQTSVWKYKL